MGHQGWKISPHAILWHILWGILKPRVEVRWTKGHATMRQAVNAGRTRLQWECFQKADELAKAASKRHGPSEIDIAYRTRRIEAVQLASSLASEIWAGYLESSKVWVKEQAKTWTRERPVKLEEITRHPPPFPRGMHHFAREGDKVWCTTCGKTRGGNIASEMGFWHMPCPNGW